MAADYSQYNDLLTFINSKLGDNGWLTNPQIYGGSYDSGGMTASINPEWLANPSEIFNLSGPSQVASYNPYFSTEVRDYTQKIAESLGLSKDDANKAALSVAQNVLQSQGGQELYSEATSPVIIADRILQQLYSQAGQPYTPLTQEQQQHYANVAQDYQTAVKAQNQDSEDAADLQSGLWAGSVLAGPVLGGAFSGGGDAIAAGTGDAALAGDPAGDLLGGENAFADAGLNVNPGGGNPNLFDASGNFLPNNVNPDPGLFDAAGNFQTGAPTAPATGPFPASPDASLGSSGLGGLGTATAAGAGAGAANNALNNDSGDQQQSGGSGSAAGGLLGGLPSGGGGINLGNLLGAGLGLAGSYNQTEALKELAQQQMAMGQPFRDMLAQLYTPEGINTFMNSASVQAPVQQGTDALMRALSVNGNPYGSGHALQEGQNYATNNLFGQLGNERNRLANFGGLSSFNAAAPGTSNAAINSAGGMYNAAGYGLSNLVNGMQPQNGLRMLGLA